MLEIIMVRPLFKDINIIEEFFSDDDIDEVLHLDPTTSIKINGDRSDLYSPGALQDDLDVLLSNY